MGERPTLEQLSPYLHTRAANVHISRCRVIGIGESHPYTVVNGVKTHHPETSTRDTVNQLIQAIAKPGDILLVEGHAYGEVADFNRLQYLEFDVPEWLTVIGWDDMFLRRRALRVLDTKGEFQVSASEDSEDHKISEIAGMPLEAITLALQRNVSMQGAIYEMEKLVPEGNKLIVVAGENHWKRLGDVDVTAWLERNYAYSVLFTRKMIA